MLIFIAYKSYVPLYYYNFLLRQELFSTKQTYVRQDITWELLSSVSKPNLSEKLRPTWICQPIMSWKRWFFHKKNLNNFSETKQKTCNDCEPYIFLLSSSISFNYHFTSELNIVNDVIKTGKQMKVQEVVFDSKMSWTPHIDHAIMRGKRLCGGPRFIRNKLNIQQFL